MISQVGIHFINSFSGTLDSRVPIVKCVDASIETIAETISRVGQAVPVIVRWYEPNQSLSNPVAAADDWFERRQYAMTVLSKLSPLIAFEGFNEIHASQIPQYIQHETRRLELMHCEGFAGVYINSSSGTYEPEQWKQWSGFFGKLWPRDFIGAHEYGSGYFEKDYPHLIGRAWDFKDIGQTLKDVPLVVTEFGALASYADIGWKVCLNHDWQLYKKFIERCDEYYRSKGVQAVLYTGGNCAWGWETHCVNDVWDNVRKEYPLYVKPPTVLGEPPFVCGPVFRQFGWPVTQRFGENPQNYPAYGGHHGVDYGCPEGTEILSPVDGIVDLVGYEGMNTARKRGHYLYIVGDVGKEVASQTGQARQMCEFAFFHLRDKPLVKRGERVRAGQLVGYTGNTGLSTAPHLHLGLMVVRDEPGWPANMAFGSQGWINPLGGNLILKGL